ncbi:MAG: DUF1573 domain-containing protein [Candidatus Aureabacteria bacterium]|nr:DUF1573 domain-containing protein [Candidatus Auribacterota bacterium]
MNKNLIFLIMKKAVLMTFFFFLFPVFAMPAEIAPQKVLFGDVQEDALIEREIIIFNNEPAAIELKKIRSSCDCLIIDFNTAVSIEPEKELKVIIKLDPSKLGKGKFRKYLFLEMKNSKKSLYSIEVHGTIL